MLSLSGTSGISERVALHLRQWKIARGPPCLRHRCSYAAKQKKQPSPGSKPPEACVAISKNRAVGFRASKMEIYSNFLRAYLFNQCLQNTGSPLPAPAASFSAPAHETSRRPHTASSVRCPGRHTGRSAWPDNRRFSAAAAVVHGQTDPSRRPSMSQPKN